MKKTHLKIHLLAQKSVDFIYWELKRLQKATQKWFDFHESFTDRDAWEDKKLDTRKNWLTEGILNDRYFP